MKKILLSATALSFALTASAFAADLPNRKAPAYIPPPPPPPLWSGFYVGLNAGGTFSDNSNVLVQGAGGNVPAFFALQSAGAVPTSVSLSNSGFIGGGQVGYNYQFGFGGFGGLAGGWLVGIEADIGGIAGSSNNASAGGVFGPFPFSTSVNRSLDYIGTVRGRLGYLFTPTLLIYGTGGLAYGGANLGLNLAGPAPFAIATSYSDTRVGWTAGGGVEWMFMPNWSAKIEYLYYNLGTAVGPAGFVTGGANFDSIRPVAKFSGNIVRAGVNYHFNWAAPAPVLAKY
jgi:outer membrane immunogenic protein